MTGTLPQLPFVELPPPADGLGTAVRRGRRMRLRRRLATTGAATAGVAAVFAVVALNGPASTGAQDELIPAQPRPAERVVAVAASASPAGDARAVSAAPGAAKGTEGGAAPVAPAVGAPARANTQPAPTPASRHATYRTPELLRSYRTATPAPGPNPRLCSGAVSSGRNSVDASNNWCFTAQVTKTAAGHDLSVQVCRDSTGAGQLHYSRRLEVDLTVAYGTRTVWRWSPGHADRQDPHVLDVAADACWTWTARWTDVDSEGDALPRGDYTLSVSTLAAELRAFDVASAGFTID